MNQTLPATVSVLVIGAGPTGLAVAAQLGKMGIEVLVVERNSTSAAIPRAIILDDEGLRTLQAADMSEEILKLVIEGDGPLFFDEDGSLMTRVGAGPREYGFSKRYFMHQPDLEETIKLNLKKFASVALHFQTEVTGIDNRPDEVVVQLDHAGTPCTVSAKIVLACDGARSPTREFLGIKMNGDSYDDNWIVVDTLNDPDQSRNTKVYCHSNRPYLSIPAPRGGRRYEFKLLPGETRETMATVAAIQSLLRSTRTLNPEDVLRIAIYAFQARIADRLCCGRVLLLGDAAHLTPPFAGQGMNAGLRDAMNVAWKVALVVRDQAPLLLLNSYEVERRKPIWSMIQFAVVMGDIIMPRSKQDSALRAALFAKLDEFPGWKDFMMGMKFKPRPRYAEGVFIGLTSPSVPASLVGAMIPQPRVTANGNTLKLDDIIGPNFAIIVQSTQAEQFASDHLHELWPELQPTLISFAAHSAANSRANRVTVLEPEITFPLLAHRDQLLLVRPDRYAAVAFWPSEAEAVVREFRTLLTTQVTTLNNDLST